MILIQQAQNNQKRNTIIKKEQQLKTQSETHELLMLLHLHCHSAAMSMSSPNLNLNQWSVLQSLAVSLV